MSVEEALFGGNSILVPLVPSVMAGRGQPPRSASPSVTNTPRGRRVPTTPRTTPGGRSTGSSGDLPSASCLTFASILRIFQEGEEFAAAPERCLGVTAPYCGTGRGGGNMARTVMPPLPWPTVALVGQHAAPGSNLMASGTSSGVRKKGISQRDSDDRLSVPDDDEEPMSHSFGDEQHADDDGGGGSSEGRSASSDLRAFQKLKKENRRLYGLVRSLTNKLKSAVVSASNATASMGLAMGLSPNRPTSAPSKRRVGVSPSPPPERPTNNAQPHADEKDASSSREPSSGPAGGGGGIVWVSEAEVRRQLLPGADRGQSMDEEDEDDE